MINFYIDYEHTTTSFMLLKNRLESLLEKKLKKLNKILSLIKKDIEDSKTMDSIKEKGDILASVLYNVKRGMNSIKAYDFYNNKEVEIELDPLISPNENLDRIYKRYNKVKRGLTNAIRREKEIKEEITYVESSLLFIENSTDVTSLREIEEELIKLNYTYDQMISLMKHASINDFQILIDNNYSYSKIQPYLNINGILN